MDWLSLAGTTLFSPAVLFFVLGLLAAIVRSDLAIPDAIAKGLSLYLVMAIGFKGGAEMAVADPSSLILLLCAGIILSAGLPLIGFGLLRATTGVSRIDAAAIAAHYGSISIVTFIAANDAGAALGQAGGGYMVAVAAAMEAPAILTGLILAGRALAKSGGSGSALSSSVIRDAFTNGSILLLLGAFAIGWTSGPAGMAIFSFILSCSHTLSSAFAHCAPLLATAGTPMPAVVESPQRKRPGSGVVTLGNSKPPPAASARP